MYLRKMVPQTLQMYHQKLIKMVHVPHVWRFNSIIHRRFSSCKTTKSEAATPQWPQLLGAFPTSGKKNNDFLPLEGLFDIFLPKKTHVFTLKQVKSLQTTTRPPELPQAPRRAAPSPTGAAERLEHTESSSAGSSATTSPTVAWIGWLATAGDSGD